MLPLEAAYRIEFRSIEFQPVLLSLPRHNMNFFSERISRFSAVAGPSTHAADLAPKGPGATSNVEEGQRIWTRKTGPKKKGVGIPDRLGHAEIACHGRRGDQSNRAKEEAIEGEREERRQADYFICRWMENTWKGEPCTLIISD